MAVMYILLIMPMEHTLWVTTPQKAFGPVTRIQTRAQTRLGMVRISRISRLKIRAIHFGTTLSQARKLKGIARMPPISVPRKAMAMVWNSR